MPHSIRPAVLGLLLLLTVAPARAEDAPPASTAPTPSPLQVYLEAGATHSGALGWKGLQVGSFVEFQSTHLMPTTGGTHRKSVSDTRTALTDRKGDSVWLQTSMRMTPTAAWRTHPARKRERLARKPAPTRVERPKTTLVLGKTKYECREIAWVVKDGGTTRDSLVLFVHAKHGVLRWISHEGNWTNTYTAMRLQVDHVVGKTKLDCREFERIATASNMNTRMESLELWCAAIPDWLVRSKTEQTMPGGATSTQVRKLTNYEARTAKANK